MRWLRAMKWKPANVAGRIPPNPTLRPTAMNTKTREIILQHWACANRRDWIGFGELLDPGLLYQVPQTREYIDSGAGYLDMFCTWPGDWKAIIKTLICEDSKAVCIIDFVIDTDVEVGVSVFELANGRIVAVTDYWPETYEPPPRRSAYMKRRPR